MHQLVKDVGRVWPVYLKFLGVRVSWGIFYPESIFGGSGGGSMLEGWRSGVVPSLAMD